MKKIKTFHTEDGEGCHDIRKIYQQRGHNCKREYHRQSYKNHRATDPKLKKTMGKRVEPPTLNTINNNHLKLGNVMKINKKINRTNNQQSDLFNKYIESIKSRKFREANLKRNE